MERCGGRRLERSSDPFDDVVREYISFVNEQVGTYMDALAGFAGHHTRVERQNHRASRPSKAGKNEKGESVVVWASYEDPTKPDIMGDMRVLRNVILHSKSILRSEKHKELKKLGGMFAVDQPLNLSYEDMHQIFVLIKQDCGRLMFEWLGVKDSPIAPDEIREIAIQKGSLGERSS